MQRCAEGWSSKPTTLIGENLSTSITEEQLEWPLVTVITATFNAAKVVEACLESVRTQDYPHIEHLIIDGASTDRTVELVRMYQDRGLRWISEPDQGIYDAWNKGLGLARGEWVAFLGADDIYAPGAIKAFMSLARKQPNARYLSGRVRWISSIAGEAVIGGRWEWPRFQRYMCTAHVGSMHHRQLYETYGKYKTSLRIVGDYEFLLRAGPNLPAAFLDEITATMQGGGMSDSAMALDETARVKVETGRRAPTLVFVDRILARLGFRMRRVLATFYAGNKTRKGNKC